MKTPILLSALLLSGFSVGAQHAGYNPQVIQAHQQSGRTDGVSEFEVAKAQVQAGAPSPIRALQGADLVKLKQDADQLATLAQLIPSDVDQTTKGILPKDLDQRLKRIEKLAKQLRSQISH